MSLRTIRLVALLMDCETKTQRCAKSSARRSTALGMRVDTTMRKRFVASAGLLYFARYHTAFQNDTVSNYRVVSFQVEGGAPLRGTLRG